tara:strand:+ start:479 stop:721 length:243 start_codon:yes stop_codon:yes gene_type:complete
VFGLIILGPLGIIIGSFGGAFLGELITNPKQRKAAIKTAVGSLVGFISGFLLKNHHWVDFPFLLLQNTLGKRYLAFIFYT